MTYKEYNGYTKTYVLVYNTGTGVMEDRYIAHEVVYETDSLEDAKEKSHELELKNNTKEEIESTWVNNTYHININTLSKEGKKLSKQFSNSIKNALKKLDVDNYRTIKIGKLTFILKKFNCEKK